MTTVVSAQGLTKEYRTFRRKTRALSAIDLEIGSGETFGLLGPNGAGKTTFVKCLLGLLRPTEGSVQLFGKSPSASAARSHVGFAPEIPQFPSFLSASEVMDLHGRLADLSGDDLRKQSASLLKAAELTQTSNRVKTFSKGMVRRLALAQALLAEPKFLVLDEPTADLDPIGRRDVRNQLMELKQKGVTILLNSHLLSEVERICDRVAILHQGRVLAIGKVDDLVPEGQDLESVFVELVERAKAEGKSE